MLVAGLEGKSGKHGDHGDHGGKAKTLMAFRAQARGITKHTRFWFSSVVSVVSVFPSFGYFTKPSNLASGR